MTARNNKKNSGAEYALVYSTDPIAEQKCPRCHQKLSQCECSVKKEDAASSALNPTFRIERKGRGGKTVTIIGRLPPREALLKDLCGYLKKAVGGGGTFYLEKGAGIIEIQGDKRDDLVELVAKYRQSKGK